MLRASIALTVLAAAMLLAAYQSNEAEPTPGPTDVPNPNALFVRSTRSTLPTRPRLRAAATTMSSPSANSASAVPTITSAEVRGGAVEAGAVTDTSVPLTPDRLAEYRTVDQLFDLIQQAIDEDAAEIRVTYATEG
jgi:hypothetical protein